MLFEISWVYFIIPILCFICFVNKQNKYLKIGLIIIVILILYFSKNGADYNGYLSHFKMIEKGIDLSKIHGEILFKKYMKFFFDLGYTYEFFRIIHLSLCGLILYYSINKLSKNFFMSMYILYCGYIIYLISAYRQLISITFLIFGLYLVKKNRLNFAIIINFVGILFHISSIWSLLYFLFLKFKIRLINYPQKINLIFLLCISFLIRGVFFIFPDIFIKLSILIEREDHFYYYFGTNKYFVFGILTRLVPCVFLLLFYETKKIKEIITIVNFYILSIIMYIMIPIEGISGRMFTNGRVFEILIFPYIFYNFSKGKRLIILKFIVIYYLLVLINQLLRQGGYYPYINILFS